MTALVHHVRTYLYKQRPSKKDKMPLAAQGSLTGAYILLFLVSSLLVGTSAQIEFCGHDVYDVESLKKYCGSLMHMTA